MLSQQTASLPLRPKPQEPQRRRSFPPSCASMGASCWGWPNGCRRSDKRIRKPKPSSSSNGMSWNTSHPKLGVCYGKLERKWGEKWFWKTWKISEFELARSFGMLIFSNCFWSSNGLGSAGSYRFLGRFGGGKPRVTRVVKCAAPLYPMHRQSKDDISTPKIKILYLKMGAPLEEERFLFGNHHDFRFQPVTFQGCMMRLKFAWVERGFTIQDLICSLKIQHSNFVSYTFFWVSILASKSIHLMVKVWRSVDEMCLSSGGSGLDLPWSCCLADPAWSSIWSPDDEGDEGFLRLPGVLPEAGKVSTR